MKKTLFVCTLFFMLLGSLRASAQTLVLHHPGGTTTDVELYTQPRVEFQDDKVMITSPVLNIEYPKAEVLRFTYKGTPVSISAAKGKADVSRDGDRLVFHGVKANDKVAVYTADGIRVPVSLTRSATDATLTLAQIPKGVYLISVNGRTSKFTRQ